MTNTPLNRVPRDKMSPEEQESWDHLTKVSGGATIIEVFANSPKVSKLFSQHFYAELFYGGDVQLRYKELLRYRLSLLHGCNTCNRNNRVSLKEAGFTDADLDAVEDFENGPFSDADKAAIALAEQLAITNTAGTLSPALYARLKKHFSDSDIVELSVVAGMLGGLNKMAFALDIVNKEDYCPFVPQRAAE